jgi:hypothetical protein
MAITETLRALGSWGVSIDPTIPDEVWKKIDYFDHVCIHVGRKVNPKVAGDSLLKSARYVGPIRTITENGEQRSLSGSGMASWLGDADDKGDVIEDLVTIAPGTSIPDTIRALLPTSGSIVEGTFNTMAGKTYSGTFQFMSPKSAIDYVLQTVDGAWRTNGDGTLDTGNEGDLFTVNPKVVVLRKKGAKTVASFDDMFLRSLGGTLETARDVEDLTTRVLLMAQGSGGAFASATADAPPGAIPYVDIHGNPVKFTRIVQESETDDTNADARAQLQLNRFLSTRDALTLSSAQYDINGDARVGDYLWVYDPEIDVQDYNNEIQFRGKRLNPFKLKLTESTWPITNKMSVFVRTQAGEWLDLSDYVNPENGTTTLVVGGYNRSLSEGSSGAFPVTPPDINTTIPGIPMWVEPFRSGIYQSPTSGETKANVDLEWTRPDNTDASTITDGDHWEIRYRTATSPLYPTTHAQMAFYTHTELADGTWGQPIHYDEIDWAVTMVPWESLRVRLGELTPSMPYEAQIRAVDNGKPANVGDWSDLTQFQVARDTLPPATPAAPEVAGSLIAIEVVHRLGRSDGGEFNLDRDLHHLEIHAGLETYFEPTPETLLGKMLASWGMISGEVPVVGTFPVKEVLAMYIKVVAVDLEGNKSLPSPAAVATAELVDDLHVANMSVSKLTAGRLTADVINAASIKTGETGARVEINYRGIQAFNEGNIETVDIDASDGSVHLNLQGDKDGLEVNDSNAVQRLHVATSDVTIRDSAGNEVFSNENTSGWGITQPNLQTAFYPTNSDAALQTGTADSNYYPKLVAGHIINHPTIKFGVRSTTSGGTGLWKVSWFVNYPSNVANPSGETIMASGSSNTNTSQSYTFPSDMFGQRIFIAYLARLNSGAPGGSWTDCMPTYFYGTGS